MNRNDAKQHIEFYIENYNITTYKLKTENIRNEDKEFIGDKNKRKCRFCGKEKGETTFKKIAHAIPELIGNKVLISYEECDECNKIFSKLENELANYLSFERSTTGIRGKTGIPVYKNKTGLRIEHEKEEKKRRRIIIQDVINSGNIVEDSNNNSFTIKGERSPYVPLSVYKCFVKMALSIMPKHYLPYFWETFDWIREENYLLRDTPVCKIFEQFIPGPKPFIDIEMILAIRKWESSEKTPFGIFVICFENFSYQIYLPFAGPDCIDDVPEEKYKYLLFPSKYEMALPEGTIHTLLKDFSASAKVKGQTIDITYNYDEKEIRTDSKKEV
ncbi:HNH endonuclease [Bacillus manliponensis]|uniref:HNH endonuclease n=1 Tax=Bacillus manliponensis TaxID=574376 RepID=UPI00068ED0CD|nr:HNH endonuclease [Bacillus manliponensis]